MNMQAAPGYVGGFAPTLNLRELGGWNATDGRTVRRGLLYRGSALVDLTDEERARIDSFGLRFILDLRAVGECEGRADYVPDGAEYLRIGGMYSEDGEEVDFSPAGISRIMDQIQSNPEHFLSNLYASMLFGNPAVHALVERFVRGQVPLYFHCTAGKDRTGVCAATLLMLLGVSDDAIVKDFLLTNEYRAEIINNPPSEFPAQIPVVTPDEWARMNGVAEETLRGTLAVIDKRYPTREDYFAAEFGIDSKGLAALRNRYLA